MKTWRTARLDERCGDCSARISRGEPILHIELACRTLFRCRDCGERFTGAPVPAVIEDVPPVERVLSGIRYQPSLGFGEKA